MTTEKIYRVYMNGHGTPNFSTAEEIVRCKDCKKADTRKCANAQMRKCPFYSAGWGYTDEDYCSEGE